MLPAVNLPSRSVLSSGRWQTLLAQPQNEWGIVINTVCSCMRIKWMINELLICLTRFFRKHIPSSLTCSIWCKGVSSSWIYHMSASDAQIEEKIQYSSARQARRWGLFPKGDLQCVSFALSDSSLMCSINNMLYMGMYKQAGWCWCWKACKNKSITSEGQSWVIVNFLIRLEQTA